MEYAYMQKFSEKEKGKEGQRSLRIVVPEQLYDKIKEECLDHGDISRLVRRLLVKHLEALGKV